MLGSEAEAREWVQRCFDVPRETMDRLAAFESLLRAENGRQNLVAKASLDRLWARHIADSAQLVRFAPFAEARWVDLGSGAGFPGLIVALLHRGPVTLIEERRLRVDFLHRAAEMLAVGVEIVAARIERAPPQSYDAISARALAPLPKLLDLGTAFSTVKTVWILPKGRKAQSELEALEPSWQGEFRLEPSLTDAQSRIVVARGVHKAKRKR